MSGLESYIVIAFFSGALIPLAWVIVLNGIRLRRIAAQQGGQEAFRTLEAVIDATPVAIIRLDLSGRVTLWNAAAERIFGWTRDEVLHQVLPIIPLEERGAFFERFRRQLTGEFPQQFEMPRRRKDGSAVETCLWWTLLRGADGRPAGVVGAIADNTESKCTERALTAAKIEAERANKAKSFFLANLSHELRTPLSAIIGFSELVTKPGLAVEQVATHLSTIRRNGLQLKSLVDDMLDLARIEAETMVVEPVDVSLSALLAEIETVLGLRAKTKGIDLSCHIEPHVPDFIRTDPVRLRQMLLNVAGNAVKFTNVGSVSLAVLHDRDAGQLLFRVEDTGPGIPAEQVEAIFEPFVQGSQELATKRVGAGLGLALASRLAQVLGGDIRLLRNDPGQGSTFEMSIAAHFAAPAARRAGASTGHEKLGQGTSRLAALRILVVEDNPDLQDLMVQVLGDAGVAKVGLAENGVVGVAKAMSGAWDVVLMDLQMPRLNGYDAARRLRQQGFTRPIVALTAYAMPDERQRSLAAGCDDCVIKPLQIATLLETLERLVPFIDHGGDAAGAEQAMPAPPLP